MSALLPSADAPLLLSCSPRRGGNCDYAAELFASTAPAFAPTIRLCDYRILPCTGCSACLYSDWQKEDCRINSSLPYPPSLQAAHLPTATLVTENKPYSASEHQKAHNNTSELDNKQPPAFNCPCTLQDESAALLYRLAAASELCIVSPIYFYHLPAQFKAFLDRLQPFWLRTQNTGRKYQKRCCRLILIGARKQGKKLFEGSILSIRYALAPLGFSIKDPLLLYGLDEATALQNNKEEAAAIMHYSKDTASTLTT